MPNRRQPHPNQPRTNKNRQPQPQRAKSSQLQRNNPKLGIQKSPTLVRPRAKTNPNHPNNPPTNTMHQQPSNQDRTRLDSSKRPQTRNEDTIPCQCGCGTLIKKYGSDRRQRRFARGHQFYGNTWGQKPYNLDTILQQAETHRPNCACGCGEKLDIPPYLQTKGKGIKSIQNYWNKHPYKKGHGLWDTRTQNYLQQAQTLDPDTLGLIYGTLLGDGSITYPNKHSRYPRLAWTHGEKQQQWLEYKASRLPQLEPKLRLQPNRG